MLKCTLALTILLECLALLLLKEKSPLFHAYWIAVNTLTNLSINLYLCLVFSGSVLKYWLTVTVIEILVFATEYLLCLLYTKDKKKSVKYSVICNLTSCLFGLIIITIL